MVHYLFGTLDSWLQNGTGLKKAFNSYVCNCGTAEFLQHQLSALPVEVSMYDSKGFTVSIHPAHAKTCGAITDPANQQFPITSPFKVFGTSLDSRP